MSESIVNEVTWDDIVSHMLDVYLYQLPEETSIASSNGNQVVKELVGKAKNFVIVLLDSTIVGGQPIGTALTPKPTTPKRSRRKPTTSTNKATP